MQTEACVEVLFDQLRRVKNTNSTRRYLNELIDGLSTKPSKLVRSGFEALAEDESMTYKMRLKFRKALEDVEYNAQIGL